MPEINNISNLRGIDSKKVTSKLSFQVGEVFHARVVNTTKQNSEITLKTMDGWQFVASTDLPMEGLPEGLVKFMVVGYKDGKLQVVVVPSEAEDNSTEEKSIDIILRQQNLSGDKKDIEIFKSMIKHGMPLTKDNISFIKTIMDFKEKITSNEEKENEFINKYLQSKGIDLGSEEGNKISVTLKSFFKELKKVSLEDILTLKENGIELTESNLKSFNKVFKGDTVIYKELVNDISASSKKLDNSTQKFSENTNFNKKNSTESAILDKKAEINNEKGNNEKVNNIEVNRAEIDNVEADVEVKVDKENTDKTEIDNGNKTNVGNVEEDKIEVKDTKKAKPEVANVEIEATKEDSTDVETKVNIPKDNNQESEIINDDKNNKTNNQMMKGETKGDYKAKSDEEFNIVKNIIQKEIPLSKNNVKIMATLLDIKEKIPSNKAVQEKLINKFVKDKGIDLNSAAGKELVKNLKSFFSDVKKDNFKEIIDFVDKEPEFKDIIKDISKDILKNNVKENKLSEAIKTEITQKTELMKDIINSIKEGDWSLLKNNINDFKVFNSVSNQYYFMDVPINLKKDQYECKLLIKDERKKGKKIDSKNVKMMVSVKTINMGKVDAFIKVNERNIKIDLKCNEDWVKTLESEGPKLCNTLQELNYNVSLKVEKRMDEANIVTAREFFQDNNVGGINTVV